MSLFNSLGSSYDFSFVLKSILSFGGKSNDLEKLLEEKYGGRPILLYKGREAIELALEILNLPKGSFVVINGFTCFAVYEAIKKVGLNIEYLDIEKGELNFSAEILEKANKKNPKIKAVVIQNTLGYPCEIEKILKICKDKNITLIEDLAHSVGAKYEDGREAGTVGDITILSFSQDKIIDGISGGALIIKNNKNFLNEVNNLPFNQQLRDRFYPFLTYLIRGSYSLGVGKLLHLILKKLNLLSKPMPDIGGLHKLPSWYTKLISQQFKSLDNNLNHRKNIALIYNQMINPKVISAQISKRIESSSNLRFPIFITKRDDLIKYLSRCQIYVSDIWYDAPIAPKKYLRLTNYNHQCPNSELISSHILNLPTHKNISVKDAEYISKLINKFVNSKTHL